MKNILTVEMANELTKINETAFLKKQEENQKYFEDTAKLEIFNAIECGANEGKRALYLPAYTNNMRISFWQYFIDLGYTFTKTEISTNGKDPVTYEFGNISW